MKRAGWFAAAWIFFSVLATAPTWAQGGGAPLRGQVFDPQGRPITRELRIQVVSMSYKRPPEYIYTDSRGRFLIPGLQQGVEYQLIVESDGQNWDTTVVTVLVHGPLPQTVIHLHKLEKRAPPQAPGNAVSVDELKDGVPPEARKAYNEGLELLREGDIPAARKRFEQAIALHPEFVDAHIEMAAALMREEKLPQAEEHLRRALEIDAAAPRVLLTMGLWHYRQERFGQALPYLEKGVQAQPTNANGQLLLGLSLARMGREAHAEPVLVRAYELGGAQAAQSQFYLARIYLARNDYPRAAAALENYLRDVPDDPSAPRLRQTLEQIRAAMAQQPPR